MTTGTTGKMKAIKTNEACAVCLQESRQLSAEDGGLCPSCTNIADLLRKKPDALLQLSRIAGITETSCLQAVPEERELPDVLNGVRYRTTDRERNTWYVSVSELDGDPVEIFASTAFDRDQHLQSRISNLTTITRLISLILRHIFMGERLTLEKTLTQLKRSSRQPNDLPDMLGIILAKYTDKIKKNEKEGDNGSAPP
jgi:hypothetical protein